MIGVSDLMSKPYQKGGRGKPGYDCFGLMAEILRRQGCAVPDEVTAGNQVNAEAIAARIAAGQWQAVEAPAEGVVVAIRVGPWVQHVGVCLDGNSFIHAHKDYGISLARLDDMRWSSRIAGFYRWAGPCN